jgi:serine/threonine-protein kinase
MTDNLRIRQLLDELLSSEVTPEDVCSSCPQLLPEVRERWRQMCRVRADLDALFPPAPEPGTGPPPLPQEEALPRIPGYEVEALLGKGGMGVVYKARHLALKRTVALKMLPTGLSHPAERARFRAEAEAVARLQHPNIVQIHEIGEADGRPFFALEFVEGGSLAARLAGQDLPPRDAARLVAVLAEAMHLAHSRNLVHRDLKPGNVLLAGAADTPIGQCQPKVTDFGLARQLDADSGQTQVGLVMGTPSYMAPEQAEGRAHAAGPAADVWALGAILYECLTGRPPFKGTTSLDTLVQVRSREPAAPSALRRQVPRDLETICLKCLRKQPERRYSSARELANDLGRFVRGEPVAARPVGVVESVGKWVWRRPAAAGLLAALVLLAAAGGVGAWLLSQQRAAARTRQAQTDQEVRRILERERGHLEQGWQAADLAKLTEARAEGDRAVKLAGSNGASPAVQEEAQAFAKDAAENLERLTKDRDLMEAVLDVSASQETNTHVRQKAGRLMELIQPSMDEQYAAAFRRWGLDVDRTAENEVVARLGAEPGPVVQELIAALDGWMLERRRQKRPEAQWRRLFRVADRLDRNKRHRRLRALLAGGSPPRAESVAGWIGLGSPWPTLWAQARGIDWRQLLEVRKEIDPRREPVLTVVLLAQAFAAVGDAAGAEQLLVQAVTARPNEVVLLDLLGKVLEQQGPSRLGEAIGYYRAARGQRRHLGVALSKALLRAGRPSEAEDVLQELVRRQPDKPAVWFYLANALVGRQKYGEAEAAYREAIALEPKLAKAYTNLGHTLTRRGKHREAEAACRKAVALEPDLAAAHTNLGNALNRQRKHREAEAACRKAIALEPDLAEAHAVLGIALNSQRKHRQAEAACRKAIALKPRLAAAHVVLGSALSAQAKHRQAEAACRKAIRLEPDFAEAHLLLGTALNGQSRHRQAEVACRKAIALKPKLAAAHALLGTALIGQRKYREAEAACRKALALEPDLASSHTSLGSALSAQAKHREAEAAYRAAIAREPDFAEAHALLGIALLGQRKYREAEAACCKAIALKPDLAEAYYTLGVALKQQTRFDKAAALLKKAGDSYPTKHPRWERVRQLQQECQRYARLHARLPAFLRGTAKPANAAEQIDLARLCFLEKYHSAAARFFRDAFTAEPKLAEDVPQSHRYNAACAAARVGCGQGKDARKLDDKDRALWRRQALAWLRQDLAWWDKALDKGNAQTKAQVQHWMQHWQNDDDLAGVRGKVALSRLPAEERKTWERLWSDVGALHRRASRLE